MTEYNSDQKKTFIYQFYLFSVKKQFEADVSRAKRRRRQLPAAVDDCESVEDDRDSCDTDIVSSNLVLGLRLQCSSGYPVPRVPASDGQCVSNSCSSSSDDDDDDDKSSDDANVTRSEGCISEYQEDASLWSEVSGGHNRKLCFDWLPTSVPRGNSTVVQTAVLRQSASRWLPGATWWQMTHRQSFDGDADHLGFVGYESDTYQHRRSLEAKYHPLRCLANQPQVCCNRPSG